MPNENLIKQADLQRISEEGTKIYEKIKSQFEPLHIGKFLAIEVDESKTYMANSSAEAVEIARQENPNKVFFVVKIGYSTAETLANLVASS